MDMKDIIAHLKRNARPQDVGFMARFGITPKHALGVKLPVLRALAKAIGKDHGLALALWKRDMRETRILASLVADPKKMTDEIMDEWVAEFDYWEICDQCVMNLFWKHPRAYEKAVEWSGREEEFVRRAGFAMMAKLSLTDKKAPDSRIEAFLPYIEEGAKDDRNMVMKGVSWALRQIGKRNLALNRKAVKLAKDIGKMGTKATKWVARDVLKDIERGSVMKRFKG